MYEGAKSCVRTPVGNTEVFPIEVGLHQGSALSPFLFALILDELSRGIQEGIPWCLIFSDDIVLISDSKEELNRRLEQWRVAFESNGLHISRQKTEYLSCNFDRNDDEQECWPMTKAQERKMEVAEMRMLRWTCGKTMLDLIPNSVFRENLKVRSIVDKLREERLRWFGHVRRRSPAAPVRRVETLTVDGVRRRGRPTRFADMFVCMIICLLYVCYVCFIYGLVTYASVYVSRFVCFVVLGGLYVVIHVYCSSVVTSLEISCASHYCLAHHLSFCPELRPTV
ncbi:uncharacterized protein [Rutidosis leptorrhynchoides]|uniref:uncharacterized protein n=1 Tax=Rutidosis leptorrhynchoides TaxID=125765 RepID=UPI003A9A0297